MKKKVIISIFCIVLIWLFIMGAAQKEPVGFSNPKALTFTIPKGWPKPPVDIFANNKLTEQGFQLGKKLFYDSRLSKDGEVSCASCHQPFSAFVTFDHDLSHGVNNSFTTRNAPGLMNLAWMTSFHWDGAINHLEVQPLAPITAANEMGQSLDSIIHFLKSDASYRSMFKAAFKDPNITTKQMLKALAQFTGSLVSANSKYDRVKNGKDTFSNFEKNGYLHFKRNCASCHQEPLFTDNSFRNNGMALNRFKDIGRQKITNLSSDSLKFKVPTLRNIQLTFPYMHDGSIYSVPQVIDHYTSKINIQQTGLDTSLQKPIVLNRLQKNELVYFLYTLTDTVFTKNNRYAPDGPVYFKH